MSIKILVLVFCFCLMIGKPACSAQEKAASEGKFYSPHPTYPIRIIDHKIVKDAGTCLLQLTTDKTGKVVKARVVKSSGSALLDRNSVSFALQQWKGPANSTWQKSIEYQP